MLSSWSLLGVLTGGRVHVPSRTPGIGLCATSPACTATATVPLILLQHSNEVERDTATGSLLADERMQAHVSVQVWSWSGPQDNDRVDQLIASVASPVLVWAPDGVVTDDAVEVSSLGVASYILLDGTWQEARALFKRGPECLRSMPRVTLPAVRTRRRSGSQWRGPHSNRNTCTFRHWLVAQTGAIRAQAESAFWLRHNVGWKAKHGEAGSDGEGLLCTAEAAAGSAYTISCIRLAPPPPTPPPLPSTKRRES
jgi:DTW domain-containing protein YfiP